MESKKKVLIAESVSEECQKILKENGILVESKLNLKPEELKEIIDNYDGIIVRSAVKITGDIIADCRRLKVIGRAGVGFDNVDVTTATKKGIAVMNAPGGNSTAVAELVMALFLSCSRKINIANSSVKSGKWEKKNFMGKQLYTKTLGIIGLGRIGQSVAKLAKSFNMEIIGYDNHINHSSLEGSGINILTDLEELMSRADYITVHTPLTIETENMISAEMIDKMKPGVIIVNCARGGIIDEEALYEGLKSGKIYAAGLDVYKQEPPLDSKLLELDNVITLPHIGASTFEGQAGTARMIAGDMSSYLNETGFSNVVNLPFFSSQITELERAYLIFAEKLGAFAANMVKSGGIKSIRTICIGDKVTNLLGGIKSGGHPLSFALSKGIVNVTTEQEVTYVSLSEVLKDRNITISSETTESRDGLNNALMVEIKTETDKKIVAGNLIEVLGNQEYITYVDGNLVNLGLANHMLLFRNIDRPGVIGSFGRILGEEQVNIGDVTLSRSLSAKEAVGFITIDAELENSTIKKLLEIDGMIEIQQITV